MQLSHCDRQKPYKKLRLRAGFGEHAGQKNEIFFIIMDQMNRDWPLISAILIHSTTN